MKQKVLIIRFSSIGDIVLTTPVIRVLKAQLGAEVHYLTKKSFGPILSSNPYVDKVHLLDEAGLKPLLKKLKEENFTLICDLHNNLRSKRVKLALGKSSKSFNKLNLSKWLMVNLKINKLPHKHIVDRYLETLSHFNIKNDNKGLDYFIQDADEVKLSSLPGNFQSGYAAFAIGAQHATKRLPVHKIISICEKSPLPIVLLGGEGDKANAAEIKKQLKDKVYDGCGIYTLNQSASLVKQAKVVISHDTGLMHIASAFKKRVISVWGNTIPEFGMYPYHTEYHVAEVNDLPCRPCSKIGYPKCPKGHFHCMEWINEDQLVSWIGPDQSNS